MDKNERIKEIRTLAISGMGRPNIMRMVPGTTEWEVRSVLKDLRNNPPEELSEEEVEVLKAPARKTNFQVVAELKPIVLKVHKNKKIKSSVPSDLQTMIVVGDTHGQAVDRRAFDVACQIIDDVNPDILVHIGDLGDFYSISNYEKNPLRRENLQDDLNAASLLLGNLNQAVPDNTRKILIEGNHEDRMRRFIWNNAPALASLRQLEIPNLIGARDLGWEYVTKDIEVFPEFLLKHGATSSIHAGYTAKKEAEKSWMSGVMGHTHKLALHHFTSRRNSLRGLPPSMWIENGCLCQIDLEWNKGLSNWQQGFSIIRSYKGQFIPELIPISQGRTFFNEKLYKG